jgi:fructosamine-3-kinase
MRQNIGGAMKLQTELSFSTEQAERVLGAWLQKPVRCAAIQPLTGGMVNTVLELQFDHPPFSAVIKLNVPGQSFEREERALRHLRERAGFRCPEVYCQDSSAQLLPYTFLLLQTLPGSHLWGVTLSEGERQSLDLQLAEVLLNLHAHTRATFGAIEGAPGLSSWAEVFVPRLHAVRRHAEVSERLSPPVLRGVDAAIALAEHALADQGVPTLVHGDLWAANFIAQKTAQGWSLSGLVDPKAEYADVELELAYLQEFSCVVGPHFLAAYAERSPLREGYEFRRLFYWLHSYLEHVWLFEDPVFREKTAQVVDSILK